MGKRRKESNGNSSSGRRDFARFLLMLLPGFMFVGLLAPAAVTVKPQAEESYGPVSVRSFAPREPIYVPRRLEPTQVAAADAAVEPLFTGARYAAGRNRRAIELPAVEAAEETHEEIVLARNDGVEDYVADALFDQSADSPALRVDLKPLWDPALFDRIPGPLVQGGYTQWDDFHGNGVRFARGGTGAVVPEPRTAALLALGLVVLAVRGRKTRSDAATAG
jgi:hypothetical protein